VTKKVTATLA